MSCFRSVSASPTECNPAVFSNPRRCHEARPISGNHKCRVGAWRRGWRRALLAVLDRIEPLRLNSPQESYQNGCDGELGCASRRRSYQGLDGMNSIARGFGDPRPEPEPAPESRCLPTISRFYEIPVGGEDAVSIGGADDVASNVHFFFFS